MGDAKAFRIRRTCRGSGKIFSLVELAAPCKIRILDVRSSIDDGTEVPAKVLPYTRDNAWVLVLAVLNVPQTVELRGLDETGACVASERRTVRPESAHISSMVHTFLHDTTAEDIRNYDVSPSFGEFGIEVNRIVQAPEDTVIIHAQAFCTSDDYASLATPLEATIIGRDGKKISSATCMVMRDALTQLPQAPSCYQRVLQLSFRISRLVEAAVIWVYPQSGHDAGPLGFFAIQPHEFVWWRERWLEATLPAFLEDRYTESYELVWGVSKNTLEIQRRTPLTINPKFSIIVPLFRTPLDYFDEMVESVMAQSYQNFELILVNASPEDVPLAQRVQEWHLRDSRIRVVDLAENFGITENTNEGIKAATGDFLCFLDHDDTLTPDALFCYAQALDEYPTTDMFYSDEDHVEEGVYKNPYFKPDWEPDLLLGMNYVCHFLAVRKSIVDNMELPTKEFDGSQDHNMALRVSEVARNIYHCRKVLYHWRIHPGSTANNTGEKPYAIEAGRLAVQAHLDRTGAKARAVISKRVEGRYEVEYELDEHPLVTILIPNKDAVPVLDRCLRSIREKTSYDSYEIIVIENNSTDEATFAYYKQAQEQDERVHVVYYDGGFNYAKINNFGAARAHGDYLLLLNNDIEVIDGGWLERMVALCMREGTGAVGAKLLYPDNTVQHAGVFASHGGPGHVNMYLDAADAGMAETARLMQDVTAVTGACLMVRKAVYDELEGLDPIFEVDYNDVDFCWRVRAAGYLIVFDPSVMLYHYESVSRGFHATRESTLRFEREKGLLHERWPEKYAYSDPMGNPNFDQYSAYYQLG